MKHHARVLFILKEREDYSTDISNFTNYTVSTGMFNSSRLVSDMLNEAGIKSEVSVVVDNNKINKEVSLFKPTHVFIEGFWVVPTKFDVLKNLHPNVKWIIRCHSEIPFLAQEGNAIQWMFDYLAREIAISGNSNRVNRELRVIANASDDLNLTTGQIETLIPLLTNYYPLTHVRHVPRTIDQGVINVGCFGAIRPLKNHLVQAIAAIDYAESRGLDLNFHINSGRVEMAGSNSLKNLRALFLNLSQHKLIEHPWSSHDDFLNLLLQMDVCLQVSFTETFNIVSADAVNLGVPIVVSNEIKWVQMPHADPTSSVDISEKIAQVLSQRHYLIEKNRENLRAFSHQSKNRWLKYLNGEVFNYGLKLDLQNLF